MPISKTIIAVDPRLSGYKKAYMYTGSFDDMYGAANYSQIIDLSIQANDLVRNINSLPRRSNMLQHYKNLRRIASKLADLESTNLQQSYLEEVGRNLDTFKLLPRNNALNMNRNRQNNQTKRAPRIQNTHI